MDKAAEKTQLRKQLRQQRTQLSIDFCHTASTKIAQLLSQLTFIQSAKHIAYYWPAQNECDPRLLLSLLNNKHTYLPVINPDHQLLEFYPYQAGEVLVANQYNISEPATQSKDPIPASHLEIVLMPLLGFDLKGNRLGMGKGYYDRSFAFLHSSAAKSPLLIGLAYEIQRLEHIPCEAWDLGLDYVATEAKLYSFK